MKKELITANEPKSPISELFRTLRTNIQFMNSKSKLKSLLVTSASPSDGKSWISSNLATTFAQAGKKVILVDSDMRKGRLFSIFGTTPTPGLSNYLSGINSNGEYNREDIVRYIRETNVENLYLIPAGNVPPNPSELLVSEQMTELMQRLEEICDIVIYDGTPTTLVTDALIISRYVDSTIIVCAHNQTRLDDLETIKRDIVNVGGKIAGVVINKMPASQKEYYASYYYGHSTKSAKNSRNTHSSVKYRGFMDMQPRPQANKKIYNVLIDDNTKKQNTNQNLNYETKQDSNQSPLNILNEMNSYLEEQKRNL